MCLTGTINAKYVKTFITNSLEVTYYDIFTQHQIIIILYLMDYIYSIMVYTQHETDYR